MQSKIFSTLLGMLLLFMASLANAEDTLRYVGKGIVVVGETVIIGDVEDITNTSVSELEKLGANMTKKLKVLKINNKEMLKKLRGLKVNQKKLDELQMNCKKLQETYSFRKIRDLCEALEWLDKDE